jgi:hypothetical protein
MSILSSLQSNPTPDDPLVNQVQEKIGLKDTQLVTNHVENALNFITQEADVNPEGIESLCKDIQGPVIDNGFRSADMREKAKKGIGGLIKGFFGAK